MCSRNFHHSWDTAIVRMASQGIPLSRLYTKYQKGPEGQPLRHSQVRIIGLKSGANEAEMKA